MHPSISRDGADVLQRVEASITRSTGVILTALLVGVSYYLGSKVGFAIRFPSIPTAIIWPPNSILMAALMLTPPRRWWPQLLAALAAHLLIQSQTAVPPLAMLSLFMTNAGEAALGAYVVRRMCGGPPRFGYLRDVVFFLVFAVFVAPFVTTYGDAAAVVLSKRSGNYSLVWQARFLSNVLTVLLLVPAIVMWSANGRDWLREVTRRRFAEGCLLALGLGVTYAVAYSESAFGSSFMPALLYAPLPFLIWAALRFGSGGVSTSLLAVLLISVSYAVGGTGPFTSRSPAEDVVGLQLFLIAILVPMMVLAAVMEERSRAAEARKESEARNRAILQAIPDLMFLYTREGVYLDYHAKNPEDLLARPEEFLGRNMRDVLPPRVAERLFEGIQRAGAVYEPQVFEYDLPIGDENRWFESRMVQSGDNILNVVREITARKQAESALSFQARLLDAVEQAAIATDINGVIIFWNYFAERLYGWTKEEATGLNVNDILDNEVMQDVTAEAWSLLAKGQAWAGEYILKNRAGETLLVWLNSSPIFGEGGNVVGVIGISHDISERKKAERALRESEAKLAAELADTKQLQKISSQLQQEDNVEALYEQILDAAIALMKSDAGCIQTLDEETNALRLLVWKGFNDEAMKLWTEVRPETRSICGLALRNKEQVTAPDIEACDSLAAARVLAALRHAGLRAVQSTPLVSRNGRVLGMISTHWREPHEASEHELRLLDVVARQAADLLERRQAEEALRESEVKLAAELADAKHLHKISSLLLQQDNINALYEQILNSAIALMKSDAGSIQVLDEERNELHLLTCKGFDPASAKFWEWVGLNSRTACGEALRRGERFIAPNIELCDFMAGTEDLARYRRSALRAVQSTPLTSRDGRLVGMISTHWREPHEASENELRLLDVVARQAADLLERKRSEEALEQLSGRLLQLQDEERRRIARELHDTTAQNLLAIVLNLETLVRKAATLPQDFADAVAECQSLCEQTQSEIRTLSYLLHPPLLDEAGLILALEWLVDGFSRRSGIHVDLVTPPDFRRLSSQMETALFRVVQESLTNIYRHSGSRTAEIRLERGEGQVRLRVTDRGRGMAATGNGRGPNDKRAGDLGVGISGMRERLRQLGGRLEVRSNNSGTSVTAVLPVDKE